MSDAEAQHVPAVWVGEADAHRAEAARALAEWSRARGIVLITPESRASGNAASAIDGSIAERVEKELARAHEAIAGADADGAERALARCDALLRDHPELPNAAWLRAEDLRAWSTRYLRLAPVDKALAESLWQDSEALDGGRVPGIGEPKTPMPARYPLHLAASSAEATFRVDGVVVPAETQALAGEHAVVVMVGDRIVHASWIALHGPADVTIPIAENACTSDALGAAKREGDRIVAPNVSCPSWIAAVPSERPNAVLVARCTRDACGPLIEWRVDRGAASAPPQVRDRARGAWPGWATWTATGIGAATVLTVVLVASGVFESRAVESRFVVGGARQE